MSDHLVLSNLAVLERILNYSDHNDLANHRLVCKTWYEVSLTRWRSTSTLNVLQSVIKRGEKIRLPWKRGVPLVELREIVTSKEESSTASTSYNFLKWDTNPFSRFRLNRFNFDESLRSEKFPDFWEKIGPLMTHVHLDQCLFRMPDYNSPTPNAIQALVDVIFESTPNLEGFKMTRSRFRTNIQLSGVLPMGGGHSRWIECSIKDNSTAKRKPTLKEFFVDGKLPFHLGNLLEYFPNLERLTFHNFHSRSLRITMAELERMNMKVKPPLKHLDILHDPDSDEDAFGNYNLGKHVFPLKSLSLGTCSWNTKNFMGAMRKILKRYSTEEGGNLETLKLYAAPFQNPVPRLILSSMMTMQSLLELELWGNCVGSLCFLELMPNLRRLYINTTCFEMWDMIPEIRKDTPPSRWAFVTKFQDDMVQNALGIFAGRGTDNFVAQNLTDFYVDYEFGVEGLKTLTSWMPNLSSFSGVLTNETIKVVFEHWKDLRDLKCLYGSTVDDEGIIGSASTSTAESPKKRIKLLKKKVVNITRLTKLQTFKYEAYCGQGKLGDRSAVEGFLKMGVLQTLDICVSPQMSQIMETRLKEAIRNVKINRNYEEEEGRDAHEGQCCKRMEFLFVAVEGAAPEEILPRRSRRLK